MIRAVAARLDLPTGTVTFLFTAVALHPPYRPAPGPRTIRCPVPWALTAPAAATDVSSLVG